MTLQCTSGDKVVKSCTQSPGCKRRNINTPLTYLHCKQHLYSLDPRQFCSHSKASCCLAALFFVSCTACWAACSIASRCFAASFSASGICNFPCFAASRAACLAASNCIFTWTSWNSFGAVGNLLIKSPYNTGFVTLDIKTTPLELASSLNSSREEVKIRLCLMYRVW